MTTCDLSAVAKIQQVLHQAWREVGPLEECAVLGAPSGPNIGSYLLWSALVSYCVDVCKSKIRYVASTKDFSAEAMEREAPGRR